jgi:hypothetical protein
MAKMEGKPILVNSNFEITPWAPHFCQEAAVETINMAKMEGKQTFGP